MDLDKKIEKMYFSIGEVSELTSIEAHTLRYWESEFDHIKPQKNNVGVRRYKKSDIEQIIELKELLHVKKFTIKGAKEVLKNGLSITNDVNDNFLKEQLEEKDQKIHFYKSEIAEIKNSLTNLIREMS